MAELYLVRHGETAWSATGRHTGRTDVPLTSRGTAQATALGALLTEVLPDGPALVVTSPLVRACETARLAGLDGGSGRAPALVDDDLAEWDYGGYEGMTSAEITAAVGRPWDVFTDGVPPGRTPGETLEEVAARADAVLGRVRPVLDDGGDVVLVAHGHLLRVLTAVWLGLDPRAGAVLVIDPASLGIMGHEHGRRAMIGWNLRPLPHGP